MRVYEQLVRRSWRQAMRVAEWRVGRAAELGAAMPDAGRGSNPVLLVHGYGNDSRSMAAILRSLRRDGFSAQSLDLPSFGYGDLHGDAQVVLAQARRWRAQTGSPAVDLVGHSRGGLVARLAQVADPAAIGRVVTVASANQGLHLGAADPLAAALLPQGMQQIRRGARAVTDLAGAAPRHDVVAVGTVGIDGVLVPARAARIVGKPFVAVDSGRTVGPFSRVGHYGILRDDVAYETVRGALLRA